jgi:hypothetical protein
MTRHEKRPTAVAGREALDNLWAVGTPIMTLRGGPCG